MTRTKSDVNRNGNAVCGAKKRQGKGVCHLYAGWGTYHVGEGKCKLHGGASAGRPILHGRYSIKHRRRLDEIVQRMVDDPEPTNLAAELALSRGLLQDHLDKFVDGVMLDSQTIGNIQNMIQGIAVLVEKIDRIANRDTIVATDVVFLLQAVSAIVKTYVTDEQYADFTTKLARAVTDHSSLAGRRTVEGRVSG